MADGWKNKAQREVDSHGVCDEYSGLVRRARDRDAALDLYKRGIDWSLENNAPSLDLWLMTCGPASATACSSTASFMAKY